MFLGIQNLIVTTLQIAVGLMVLFHDPRESIERLDILLAILAPYTSFRLVIDQFLCLQAE